MWALPFAAARPVARERIRADMRGSIVFIPILFGHWAEKFRMNRGIIPKKIVSTYLKSPDLSYLRFELREGALAFFAGLVLVAPFF